MIARRAVVLSEAPGRAGRLLRWTLPLSIVAHGAAAAAGIWLGGTEPRPMPAVVTVEVVSAPGAPPSSTVRGQAETLQDAPDQIAAAAPPTVADRQPDRQVGQTPTEAAHETEPKRAQATPPSDSTTAEARQAPAAAPDLPPPPPAKPDAPERKVPVQETRLTQASRPEARDEPVDATSTQARQEADAGPAAKGEPGAQSAAVPSAGASPPSYELGSGGNPIPEYPWAARRAGREGRVVVQVSVRPDGQVAEADVAHSSGHASLDESALETVRRWRFEPAVQAGVPVAGTTKVPITFRLVDER